MKVTIKSSEDLSISSSGIRFAMKHSCAQFKKSFGFCVFPRRIHIQRFTVTSKLFVNIVVSRRSGLSNFTHHKLLQQHFILRIEH